MASGNLGLEEIVRCGICFELYNDEVYRCPRILLCGHTFCHSCLVEISKQNPSCPTCRTAIYVEKVELIPVNFAFKSMLSFTKLDSTSELQKSLTCHSVENACSSKRKLESEGYCSEHANFQELRCMDCESWICGMCATLIHRHCKTLLVKDAYEALKKQVLDKVEVALKAFNCLSLEITESSNLLNKEIKDLTEEIKKKEELLICMENCIEKLAIQESEGNKFCQKLKNLESMMEISRDNSEFSKLVNEMEDLLRKGKALIAPLKGPEIIYPRTTSDLRRLCGRQSVYVVENAAEPLYGMVKVQENRVWISSFQTGKPVGRLIPFKEFRSNFGSISHLPTRAFLQLTPVSGRNDEIEVVIETEGDTASGKNFIYLCSALKGPQYKGLTLNSFIVSSYYGLSPGPPPVVEGIKSESGVPWKEGLVIGMRKESSFFFLSLKDNTGYKHPKIGCIVSGLEKLKRFPGGKLKISDCGLIM